MSIRNIVSFLLIAHGRKPEEVRFHRPADPDVFTQPWSQSTGVTSMNMDLRIYETDIVRASRETILERLGQPVADQNNAN